MSDTEDKFTSVIEQVRDSVVSELNEWVYAQYANDNVPASDFGYIVIHTDDGGTYPVKVFFPELLNSPKIIGAKVAFEISSRRFNSLLEKEISKK